MSAREVCDQERLFHPSKYRGEILRDEQAIMVTALSADRFSFLFFKISKVLQKRGAVPGRVSRLICLPKSCYMYFCWKERLKRINIYSTILHLKTNLPRIIVNNFSRPHRITSLSLIEKKRLFKTVNKLLGNCK